MVAENTLATGVDQTVSPNSIQTAGIVGHNIESDDQQEVDRLQQTTYDGMAYLGSTLSRTRLTHKMVMLLAIASARRVSDLMLLRTDVESLQQTPGKWVFLLAFGAKQERPNHSVQPLVFSRNGENANIYPVSHLSAYMKITESDRKALSSNVLLLTCIAPFKTAARFTVARWLMLVLRDAGAGDTAGSTRAAAATWAMACGVNVNTIMQAADWTSARTMCAHYLRLLPTEALVTTSTNTVQNANIN